jgi:hypothetical protein
MIWPLVMLVSAICLVLFFWMVWMSLGGRGE